MSFVSKSWKVNFACVDKLTPKCIWRCWRLKKNFFTEAQKTEKSHGNSTDLIVEPVGWPQRSASWMAPPLWFPEKDNFNLWWCRQDGAWVWGAPVGGDGGGPLTHVGTFSRGAQTNRKNKIKRLEIENTETEIKMAPKRSNWNTKRKKKKSKKENQHI